jgi:AraC-like DNA-binding protein
MLAHGDAHVISSAPGMRADPMVDSYYAMRRDGRPFRVAYAGGPAPQVSAAGDPSPEIHRKASTTLVCGFIGCDLRPFNPLIATLPRLLHLPRTEGGGWSDRFLEAAAQEPSLRGPGGEALLERMSEMMFIDAVRRHVDALPERSTGWLAGLRDRHVGRALALMHAKPGARWTLDELSKEVGLSRSALHERFVELVGQPAMQYLTSWRMQLASQMLRSSQSSVAAIAIDVGYDSEAAFSRAFKRLVGQPPGTWRRLQAARDGEKAEADVSA